jgi:hypothetical protein
MKPTYDTTGLMHLAYLPKIMYQRIKIQGEEMAQTIYTHMNK